MALSDLEDLQKVYRNMELNRKSFAEDSALVLRQQQQKLEKLRKENDDLKADVATLQMRNSHQPMTSFEQDQLTKLYEESARYRDLIESEKETLQSMQDQITERRKQIWEHRQMTGGVNAATENQKVVEKQVRILENRLDQALVKFNKSLAHNRKLRQEIDDLRGERAAFEGVSKKLEKSLVEKKRRMAEVIEQSNQAYEQRDRAQLESMAIDQANRKETEAFDQHMTELQRILDEDLQMATAKPKPDPAATAAEEAARAEAERKAAIEASLAKEKEEERQKRLQRLRTFEEAFRKISAATGVADVNQLVASFIANEEQNFSLFSYVSEQADEIELLEGQVQELQDEAVQQQAHGGGIGSRSHCGIDQYDQVLQNMDVKTKATKNQTDKLERQCEESQRTTESIKDAIKVGRLLNDSIRQISTSGIDAAIHNTSAHTSPLFTTYLLFLNMQLLLTRMDCQEALLGEEGITDANMLDCLGAVEDKVNDILSRYRQLGCDGPPPGTKMGANKSSSFPPSVSAAARRHLQHHQQQQNHQITSPPPLPPPSSRPNLLGEGPSQPMAPDPIYVMPPRLEDDMDDDEHPITRPLTRTELQQLTANRLGNVKQPNIRRATALMGSKKGSRRSIMAGAGTGAVARRGTLLPAFH